MLLGLAVVNTACAYGFYNHALRVLPAFELSALLNLTPLMTATWAGLFLSESLSPVQNVGMVTVIMGVLVVQLGKKRAITAQPALAADAASAALQCREKYGHTPPNPSSNRRQDQ